MYYNIMDSGNNSYAIVNGDYREEKYMYCKVCGNPLRDSDVKCTVCGTAVEQPSKWADTKAAFTEPPAAGPGHDAAADNIIISDEMEPLSDEKEAFSTGQEPSDEARILTFEEAEPPTFGDEDDLLSIVTRFPLKNNEPIVLESKPIAGENRIFDDKWSDFVFPQVGTDDSEAKRTPLDRKEGGPEFSWNVYDFPKPRRTEDIRFDWGEAKEASQAAEPAAPEPPETLDVEKLFEEMKPAEKPGSAEMPKAYENTPLPKATGCENYMDETLPQSEDEIKAEKALAEATEEAKQYFVFDAKNEEFQGLLDREFERLRGNDPEPRETPIRQQNMEIRAQNSEIPPEISDDKRIDFSELYCAPIKEVESSAPRYARDPIPVYIAGLAPETVATLREIKGTTGEPAPLPEEKFTLEEILSAAAEETLAAKDDDEYATVKTIEIPAVKDEDIIDDFMTQLNSAADQAKAEDPEKTEAPAITEAPGPSFAWDEEKAAAVVNEWAAETEADKEPEAESAPAIAVTKPYSWDEEQKTEADTDLKAERRNLIAAELAETVEMLEPAARAAAQQERAEENRAGQDPAEETPEDLPPLWFEKDEDEGKSEDGDGTGGKAKNKTSKRTILLMIVAVILILEIATLGIKYFAPESGAATAVTNVQIAMVSGITNIQDKITGLFNGNHKIDTKTEDDTKDTEKTSPATTESAVATTDSAVKETTKEEEKPEIDTAPAADKATLIKAAAADNKNIKSVVANPDLAFKSGKDYGSSDLNHSSVLADNVWMTTKTGETLLYDKELVATLIAFDSQWIDYVNGGSDSVIDLTKKGSRAYENAVNYSKVGKVKETFNVLQIGEIRKGSEGYYIWAYEEITKVENGATSTSRYHYIYYLEPVDGEMKVVNYIQY